MKVMGNVDKQEVGRWKNNRAENSHLPFRRRERAMLRFRRMRSLGRVRSLQEFVAVHSSIHNHFNQERHLYSRQILKLNRSAALSEWRQLCSAYFHALCGKLRPVRICLTAPLRLLLIHFRFSHRKNLRRFKRIPIVPISMSGPDNSYDLEEPL